MGGDDASTASLVYAFPTCLQSTWLQGLVSQTVDLAWFLTDLNMGRRRIVHECGQISNHMLDAFDLIS